MAKKIPVPKVKAKKMHWLDKLFMGIGGLSPFTGRSALHQSRSTAMPSGQAAQAAHRANLLKKYGKWGSRGLRWSGLTNPWTAIPFALGYGAQHAVGSALEGYKNQDVEDTGMFFDNRGISAAGNERLLQERLAREELLFARNAARQNRRDGGLAGLL
jgi:hypothetical protein